MLSHEACALAGCALSLVGSALYIRSVLRGKTKPHFYSHLVWFIVLAVTFFAQVHDDAGPGAWITGVGALAILCTTLLSLRYGEKTITRGDRVALIAAIAAIVPWVLTKNPLWSVILVTGIDCVAYYPTLRKSWHQPWQEHLAFYVIGSIEFMLSLLALEHVSIVTALYPLMLIIANLALVGVCLLRRRTVLQPEKTP